MTTLRNKKILVTGGAGFLGRAVVAQLLAKGVRQRDLTIPRSHQHDLRRWEHCKKLARDKDIVIHLAAKVGGIGFNREKPGELFYDNLIMGTQLMEAARQAEVKKFVAVGTVCAYPKFTPVPFKEETLWNGYPEETNAPYGLAKKMLLVQAQAYRQQYGFNAIYLLPVNLYGPGDNFDPISSHVIPALIKKIYTAKKQGLPMVEVWGSGRVSREFLHITDAARGIILATEKYDKPEPINIGSGREVTIKQLVLIICKLIGYTGKIIWNSKQPDGQPRRRLDVSRAIKEFDFKAEIKLEKGLKETIAWFG